MKLAVKNTLGKDTGKEVELSGAVFGVEPNDHAIYLDVKQYHANQRQGTHKSKERNEVVGSRRKIKKQKGTGTARAGDIKNPLFRGGGRVFGPRPRDYGFKLNKKVKSIARKSALTYKAKADGGILILEDFNMSTPKTKECVSILGNLGLDNSKTLIVVGSNDKNLILSGKNLKNCKISSTSNLNTYDIMNAQTVVLVESSVSILNESLA